jgi:hypothetical protein
MRPTGKLGQTVTVRVPMALHRRGGRKLVLAPATQATGLPRVDGTLIKALARAYRWKRLIESGRYSSVADLAAVEGVNQSYLCRVLRLNLLAPDIVKSILDGRQPAQLRLDKLLKPFPVEWERQTLSFS